MLLNTNAKSAIMFFAGGAASIVAGPAFGQSPPVVIDSISPESILEKPVPQPTITISGSGFLDGFPLPHNLPTITLAHQGSDFQFEMLPNDIEFDGTAVKLLPGQNHFNLLQAPLGSYDVTITRPDGDFATLPGAFSINTQPEPEPGTIEMRVASYWGGPIMGMDFSADGNTAYIANGRVLRILDISDETDPLSIGSLYLSGVYDVKVKGDYAFVAAEGPYSFCVVDVSDPTSPELVWSQNSSSGARHLQLYGDYAYVRSTVWDISDPLNVVSIGNHGAGDTAPRIIHGDWLVTSQGIYDLAASPTNPPLISSFSSISGISGGSVSSIAVSGDHVYLAGESSLHTIDVSNPGEPTEADVRNFSVIQGIAAENGHLLLAREQSVLVFDINTNPASPSFVGEHNGHQTAARFQRIDADDTRSFIVCNAEGLIILDTANAARPVRLGKYHSPAIHGWGQFTGSPRMAKSGDNLFVLDPRGVSVLNVSDPAHPRAIGHFLLEALDGKPTGLMGETTRGMDMVLQDNLLYITAYRMGLFVVNVSDPANPTLTGWFETPLPNLDGLSAFYALDIQGDVAHIAFYDVSPPGFAHRYLTVDVSDPQNILEIARSSNYPEIGYANLLVVNGDVAFTSRDSSHSATVFDISDVQNPFKSPTAPLILGSGTDLVVHNGAIFGVRADPASSFPQDGMHVYDVSADSEHPEFVHFADSGPGRAIDVQNDRAYVVGLGNHLTLLDVSDPAVPVELDAISSGVTHTFTNSILADEPHVYISSIQHTGSNIPAQAGLSIVKVHGVEPQGPLGDLNGDGVVDVSDMLILLSAWGGCPTGGAPAPCPADLNEDGVVDVSDLLILLANWG